MYARGFTLIELLVVVAIIGMLASVVLSSLTNARIKAKDAQRLSDLRNIKTALELYATANTTYPVVSGWRSQCVGWGSYASNSVIPGLVPTYMGSFPSDPDMVVSSNASCYIYYSNGTDYKLLSLNSITSQSSGMAAYPSFIDPKRNYGTAWANNAACPGTTDGSWARAIWSGPASICW